jgi:hypothetical protein
MIISVSSNIRRLIIYIFLCLSITSCCGEINKGKQEVDVSSLYKTKIEIGTAKKISDLIDLSLFDDVVSDNRISDFAGTNVSAIFYNGGKLLEPREEITRSYVEIQLILLDSTSEAEYYFNYFCDSQIYLDKSYFIISGVSGNRYCISYVQQVRESLEILCLPRAEYISYIVFEKDRLIIILNEFSTIVNSNNNEVIIKFLADYLSKNK